MEGFGATSTRRDQVRKGERMKNIDTPYGLFGLSKMETGRHWVCMKCRDQDQDTLTPLFEHRDGDHEPDGDSLCRDCVFALTIGGKSLERWLDLTHKEAERVWEAAK